MIQGVGGATGSPASSRLVRSTRSATKSRLPRAPGRWTGGQTVRFDQRGQKIERGPVSHLVGHPLGGGGIVEITAGGTVGEQEMESDQGDQCLDIGSGGTPGGWRSRGPRSSPLRCGPPEILCRCRGAGSR